MSVRDWWRCCHRQVHPSSTVLHATCSSKAEYVQEGYCRHRGPVVDLQNDAAIARALQEELSQAADAESYTGEQGSKYVNDCGNETLGRATCCHHDCGSSTYGGNSSKHLEIINQPRHDYDLRTRRIHQMDHLPGCRHGELYPTSTVQYGTGSSREEYVQESYWRHGGSTVDFPNDAAIACGLQEKLSLEADADSFNGEAGWGNEVCRASCCRHDYGSSYDSNSSTFFEITDEPRFDGEVRNRFHHMDRITHVPKTNSRIPSDDEATSDHQRLLERLELYDLYEFKVSGDGNCQFRSLSDQLYRTAEYHKEVRQNVVDQLKANPDLYAPYVPMPYHEYLMKISTLGEWGDHVTLQAAADWYGVRIFVLTSYKDTCYIEIIPRQKKLERVIFLSFWAEVHYNSIHHIGESDGRVREPGTKKWWNLKK